MEESAEDMKLYHWIYKDFIRQLDRSEDQLIQSAVKSDYIGIRHHFNDIPQEYSIKEILDASEGI